MLSTRDRKVSNSRSEILLLEARGGGETGREEER